MNHIHFHIIPSTPEDERYTEALRWDKGQFEALTVDEREAVLDMLSDAGRNI